MLNKLAKFIANISPAKVDTRTESNAETNNIGQWAENQAKDYLRKKGLQLREQNYRCKAGEIDLIMTQGNALVFVEVRSRSREEFGTAFESVTKTKQQRLIKAAKHYLQKKQLFDKFPCRFDVISVHRNNDIEWIPNAFTANG